jgi:hypothetical protein
MVDYLLHVYRKGSVPFRTLSVLPEGEALRLMQQLYVEGSVFWERFKEPKGYLDFRKQVELGMRAGFAKKGGKPVDQHPIYLVLGSPKWMQAISDLKTLETTETIRIPLSLIRRDEVSFTYPDSMVSALMAMEKNPEYYEPEYHGQVFTWTEMKQIIEKKGLPGEGWETRMPKHYAHYIEAQVWNRKALVEYLESYPGGKNGQLHF